MIKEQHINVLLFFYRKICFICYNVFRIHNEFLAGIKTNKYLEGLV